MTNLMTQADADRLHHDLLHIERTLMALVDSIAALTDAVSGAVDELNSLSATIKSDGDVGAAAAQIDSLAANLKSAVDTAKADPAVPTPGDGTTSGDTGTTPGA